MSRVAWFLCVVCLSAPAVAQEVAPAPAVPDSYAKVPSAAPREPAPGRPPALMPLYGSFAALQFADYATTRRALSSGSGREVNPLMEPLVGHPAAFLTLKAASTAGMIWAGEKLWRKNRVGAIVFMVATDSAMATIVAHNYAIARSGRR